jgi:hypothetical protein
MARPTSDLMPFLTKQSLPIALSKSILVYFQNGDLLLLVLLAAMVYFVLFVGIKGFDKGDWELFKGLIKRG